LRFAISWRFCDFAAGRKAKRGPIVSREHSKKQRNTRRFPTHEIANRKSKIENQMKVLVTGGSGYLGTHVRRHFQADDFSRTSGLDILNTSDAAAVADYDVVIHLAAHLDKSPDAAEQVFLTNVEGTINLLKNLRRDSVLIFASTKDVYGRFADNFAEVPEGCRAVGAVAGPGRPGSGRRGRASAAPRGPRRGRGPGG